MKEVKTMFYKTFAFAVLVGLLLATSGKCFCQADTGHTRPVSIAQIDTFKIDPYKAQILKCSTGFYIEVPAKAFANENGACVKSKVELVFKDLSRADSDTVNSDKSVKLGETAFRLQAYARGERVELAQGKHLNIFYQAWSERERIAFEYKKGWQPLGSDKPTAPRPKPIAKVRFLVNDDSDKRLTPFKTVKWQIANTGGDTTGRALLPYMNTKWTNLNLSKPKYGMKEMKDLSVFAWGRHEGIYSEKGNPLFVFKQLDTLVVWNKLTGKTFNINHVKKTDYWIDINDESPTRFELVKFLGNKFIFVNTMTAAGYFWYNVDGRLIANLKHRKIDDVLMDTIWKRLAMVERIDGRHRNVELYDFEGRCINTIKLGLSRALSKQPLEIEYNNSGILIVNTGESIVAYDTAGHPLLFLNGIFNSFHMLANDKVLCINEKYEPTIMDMRNEKGDVFPVEKKYGELQQLIPQGQSGEIRNLLLLHEKDSLWQAVLLDCNKLQYQDLIGFYSRKCFVGTLDSAHEYIKLSLEMLPWPEYNPGLLLGLSVDGKTILVYSLDNHRSIYSFPYRQPKGPGGHPKSFDDGNPRFVDGKLSADRYLVHLWEQILLIDTNGKLLRDLTAQDSAISVCLRIDSNTICAISDSGLMSFYNLNGELIPERSCVIEKNDVLFYLHSAFEENKINRVDYPNGEKIYNTEGEYLYHNGGKDIIFLDTDIVLVAYASRPINQFKYRMYKIVPLPPDVWQLELSTDSNLLIEYVYPDAATLQKWEVCKKREAVYDCFGAHYFYDNRIYNKLQINRLAKYKIEN